MSPSLTAVLVPILVIALLVIANGLFVAAEFAIIGSPRTTIESLAKGGNRLAKLVERVQSDTREQDRFIATAQLGITLASLGLGMYGEHVVADWLLGPLERLGTGGIIAAHALATILSVSILTYLHIVIGEMIPKSLALQHAVRVVMLVALPMRWFQLAAYPLVVSLNGIGNGLLALFRVRRDNNTESLYTPEEIDLIVEESTQEGLLQSEAARMLHELLDFGDLTAGEVMIPRVKVVGIPLDVTWPQALAVVRRSPHTRYPVYRGTVDNVVGSFHIKDILRHRHERGPIREADVRPTPFLPETASLNTVLEKMQEAHTQIVVVLDEHGGTAGIVTIEDVYEEVVGSIHEEETIPEVELLSPGLARARGSARVDLVGEALGIEVEHPEVDTMNGLVLTLQNRPPTVGDTVEYERLEVRVTAIEGHSVGECEVRLLSEEEADALEE